MYTLKPFGTMLVVEPIKPKEVKEYTGKVLTDVETTALDVLQYGIVKRTNSPLVKQDDVVLFEKLASHKTNFGDPRLVLVDVEHVYALLEEVA